MAFFGGVRAPRIRPIIARRFTIEKTSVMVTVILPDGLSKKNMDKRRTVLEISVVFAIWPAGVDAAEDFFCGGDGAGDSGFVGGAGFEVELDEAASGEDGSGDEEDTFAAFVHWRRVTPSLFVR